MKLEAVTLEKIKNRITEKVMGGSGTWIDWQYLFDSAKLLAKCRYTLQYTYPYAYYMETDRKQLVRENCLLCFNTLHVITYVFFSLSIMISALASKKRLNQKLYYTKYVKYPLMGVHTRCGTVVTDFDWEAKTR